MWRDERDCHLRYKKNWESSKECVPVFFCLMGDHRQRLNYLHLMKKAAESGDRQGYFYYLMKAEKALQSRDEDQSAVAFGHISMSTGLNTWPSDKTCALIWMLRWLHSCNAFARIWFEYESAYRQMFRSERLGRCKRACDPKCCTSHYAAAFFAFNAICIASASI